MADWTVLDLTRDPVAGDEKGTADEVVRLRAKAAEAKKVAAKLAEIAGDTARLRMRGDYAPGFTAMLADLPLGPRRLCVAYDGCADALAEYLKALTENRQTALLALRAGQQADAVYRNALQRFLAHVPLRLSGPVIWRGLTEAYATAAPPGRDLSYLIQLGRAARLAEQDRQQARQTAIAAHERHEAAAQRCVAAIEACTAGLNPGMREAHENLLAILNGGDELARRTYGMYYDNQTEGRPWIQRKRDRPLFQGHEVPEIERDSDGFYRLKAGKADAIGAEFFRGSAGKPLVLRGDPSTLGHADRDVLDYQASLRGHHLKDRAEILAALAGNRVAKSRWGDEEPLIDKDRAGALTSLSGEEFGEYGTRHAMADLARNLPDGYSLEPVKITAKNANGEDVEITGGAGRFDQVYRLIGPNGQVGFVVAEAKAPSAALGARLGLDGKYYEQGHIEYMRSVIAAMKKDKRFESLAEELEEALENGKVDYFVVRATTKQDGDGIPHGELTAAAAKKINEEARAVRDAAQMMGMSEDKAFELQNRFISERIAGKHVYDGYVLKQFDLGHKPLLSLWP